jgi:hypothetical protein
VVNTRACVEYDPSMKRGAPRHVRRRSTGGERGATRVLARAGSCLLIEGGDMLHLAKGPPREPTIIALVIAALAILYLAVRATNLASSDDATHAIPGLALGALVLLACVAFVGRSSRGARDRRTVVSLDLRRGRLISAEGDELARLDDVRFTTSWSFLTRYEALRCSYGGSRLVVGSAYRAMFSPFRQMLRELARRGVDA